MLGVDTGGMGAEGQNRTADTTIFSRVLYRLSYLGPIAACPLSTSDRRFISSDPTAPVNRRRHNQRGFDHSPRNVATIRARHNIDMESTDGSASQRLPRPGS